MNSTVKYLSVVHMGGLSTSRSQRMTCIGEGFGLNNFLGVNGPPWSDPSSVLLYINGPEWSWLWQPQATFQAASLSVGQANVLLLAEEAPDQRLDYRSTTETCNVQSYKKIKIKIVHQSNENWLLQEHRQVPYKVSNTSSQTKFRRAFAGSGCIYGKAS